jgi:hypothetical protein
MVSIPSASNAFASASAALATMGSSFSGRDSPTITPMAETLVPMLGAPDLVRTADIPSEPLKSISVHSAFSSALSRSTTRRRSSGSRELIPMSNCTPANRLNSLAIRSICSALRTLGALNFSSARLASAARWLASAPSASAVATFSSDSLWSSAVAIFALPMHRYSMTKPMPTSMLAIEMTAFSIQDISLVKTYSATSSRTIPARIRRVACPDHRSLFSSSVFGSSFLLLVSTPHRPPHFEVSTSTAAQSSGGGSAWRCRQRSRKAAAGPSPRRSARSAKTAAAAAKSRRR